MPSLLAVISADANPMKRELAAVRRMANQTSSELSNMGAGGGGHGVKAGVLRETLVLMREISRGDWTRVPGSLSILLGQMGILGKIMGGNTTAARMLADAWAEQSAKAGMAALAATRKAAASLAAAEAEGFEDAATIAAADADEAKAEAAILNQKATSAKAIASAEAATAAEAEGVATAGAFGIISASLLVVAVAAVAVYEIFWGMKKAMEGMKMPDLKVEYVAKLLRSTSDTLNLQRQITDEVRRTVDAYNAAAAAAVRISEVTKEHFDHLRKMNEFERDPKKKAARSLELNEQERQAELANKLDEKANLDIESKKKASDAAKIRVSTAEEDAQKKKQLNENAEAAEVYLKNMGRWSMDNAKQKLAIGFGGNPLDMAARKRAIDASTDMNYDQANNAIALAQKFTDKEQQNNISRKRKSEFEKESADAAAKSAEIGLSIPELQRRNAQKSKDEAEESAAALSQGQKMKHGFVNSLQQVGAYAGPAVMENLQRKAVHHLARIDSKLDKIGGGKGLAGMTGVKF